MKGIISIIISIILFILLFCNVIISINNYYIIERNSKIIYEAMICMEDPECTLETDIVNE